MIRLFAALAPPERICARLEGLQKGLDGRLAPPENMHVTLCFFGEMPETQADDLHGALERVRAPGFDWWLDGVDAFGGAKPRDLHALVRPDPALTHLHAKIEQAARSAGLRPQARRFVPHVTLTRFSSSEAEPDRIARAIEARAGLLEGPIRADSFTLFRSDLRKGPPLYTPLADYALTPETSQAG